MKRAIFLKAGFLYAAILAAFTINAQPVDNLKSKIEAINKEMVKNTIEGNYAKNLEFYTSDAISLPDHDPMLEGIDALRKANEQMANSELKITSYEPTILKVISKGDMIIEIGTYRISLLIPGLNRSIDEIGKYLTIWEKQKDGSLKIKVETWNSNENPMMDENDEPKGNII